MFKKDKVTVTELLLRIFGAMLFVFVSSCIIFLFTKGIPVIGLPEKSDILKIEIIDTRKDKTVTLTEESDISYALKSTEFLIYGINTSESSDGRGYIAIRFYDKNNNMTEISATESNVYWKGKCRQLKNQNLFIDVIESLFLN